MKWSIVVPTRLRAAMLRTSLQALCQQSTPDFEVVVVCDGPDPATTQLSREFTAAFAVRWIFLPQNLGLSAARNAGAEAAAGALLLFLDDDVVAHPDLLRHHEDAHARVPGEKKLVFGRTLERRQLAFQSNTDRFMQVSWEKFLEKAFPQDGTADTECIGERAESTVFFGLNCSMGRQHFLDEGGFDSRLRSDEETELGFRLYRRGYLFSYAPLALIEHLNSKDMTSYYPQCWARSGENDIYRVRALGQRGAQNYQIAAMRHGPLRQRWGARVSWVSPALLLKTAAMAQAITDLTNSYWAFAVWARARRLGEYWRAVKGTGVTLRQLHELSGPAVRILAFHSLSQPRVDDEAHYYMSGPKFRQVLGLARKLGYSIAHPDDFLKAQLCDGQLILTFDDAYDDLHSELLPVMQTQGVAPVVFVVAGELGGSNVWDQRRGLRARSLLTVDQLKELHRHGAVIGAHSMNHPSLPGLPYADIVTEVRDSKHRLEDVFGCSVDWFAYPFGHVDRRVRAAVAQAGYKAAVTTAPGLNTWQDPLALRRIEIHSKDTALDIMGKLAIGKDVRRGVKNQLRSRWARLTDA